MNVIYLDQPTAKTMVDMKALVQVYKRQQSPQYEEAIEGYQRIYDNCMNEVLGR